MGLVFLLLFIIFVPCNNTWGKEINPHLLKLDLKELLEIEVTSASKYPQKISQIPAAVYVLTDEEIKQSFSNFLPELLRDVPGVFVGRITSSDWAISIRGFNDRFSNKLLVLMDGRTLYSPIYSGVYWERQDLILDDIERIEIIRGPGGSIWGANAVNGIINIITKNSWKTKGLLFKSSIGTEESILAFRYGNSFGNLAHRFYIKAREISSMKKYGNGQADDDWRSIQGGFRIDYNLNNNKNFRLSGDIYEGTYGVVQSYFTFKPPYEIFSPKDGKGFGANILLRLDSKDEKSGKNWYIQGYYDTSSIWRFSLLNWKNNIWDLEFRYLFDYHSIRWNFGGGYRLYDIDIKGSKIYSFSRPNIKDYIFNIYLQSEFNINPKLKIILGGKYEYHENIGYNFQPTFRFLWSISNKTSLWGAISRAVRVPSKGEMYLKGNLFGSEVNHLPLFIGIIGNSHLDPEKLTAIEIGYRKIFDRSWIIDITNFIHFYDDLITIPFPKKVPEFHQNPWPHLYTYAKAQNLMDGKEYGLELSIKGQIHDKLSTKFAYTYSRLFLNSKEKTFWLGEELEKQWPRNILSWNNTYYINSHSYIKARLRYVDTIGSYKIPSYWAADLKYSYKSKKGITVSLIAENIFDNNHPEFGQLFAIRTPVREVERSIKLEIKFSH